MRIGNSYSPSYIALEPSAAKQDKNKATPASEPLRNTTDLVAMSGGIRFGSPVTEATEARDSRIEQLAEAWRSGAYRPDPQRIADKLMGWGFDPGRSTDER
jgi:anti-sigma28 factor (negative regulator of flagellin synthesis)